MASNLRGRRSLHWVFKIGNRKETMAFFRDILGMKVLRHEEFDRGCEATCNGPYDGRWSKTMIGYGSEDNHFVAELTYNYGIGGYKYTNDFLGMTINSKEAVANVKEAKLKYQLLDDDHGNKVLLVHSPDGYPFYLRDSDLEVGKDYWHGILGLTIFQQGPKSVVLGYDPNQAQLELVDIGNPIEHGTAQGRIAFSCPSVQLLEIQSQIQSGDYKILTPFVTLSTPGKADVQVVILEDPDGYEICFVGDEGFRQLSKIDPSADQLINQAINNDRSDEWFRHGKPIG